MTYHYIVVKEGEQILHKRYFYIVWMTWFGVSVKPQFNLFSIKTQTLYDIQAIEASYAYISPDTRRKK